MKKLSIFILLLLALFTFVFCHNKGDIKDLKYQEGIFYNKNWSDQTGTYTNDVVETKETAIEIATAVYNGMIKSRNMNGFKPKSVFYDNQDEVWIVSFGKKNNGTIVGGDCSIAIQRKDGKVLRIWFGE